MNGSVRIFKALFWKQYKQNQWLLLFIIAGTGLFTVLYISDYFASIEKSLHMELAQELQHKGNQIINQFSIFAYIFGFILAIKLFLPMISIDLEKKTLPQLAIKPVSSGACCFYSWVSVFLLSLFTIMFAIGIFIITFLFFLPFLVTQAINFSISKIIFTYSGHALLTLFAFSCYFSFFSSFSSNRIRGLGFAILCLIALSISGGYLFSGNFRYYREYIPFNADFVETTIYGICVSPFSSIILFSLFFIPFTLFIFHFQLFQCLQLWRRYTIALVVLLVLFISNIIIHAPDSNLTVLGISWETLGPETSQFITETKTENCRIGYLPPQAGGYYFSDHNNIPRSGYLLSFATTRPYLSKEITNAPVHFIISDPKSQPYPEIIFDKPIHELFSIEKPGANSTTDRNTGLLNRDCWGIQATKTAGILQGILSESRAPEKTQFVLGHFTLGKEIQFTPLKRCVFHYTGQDGPGERVLECIQPGLFSVSNINEISEPLFQEYESRVKTIENPTLDDLRTEINIREAFTQMGNFQQFPMKPQIEDHSQGNCLYIMYYTHDRNDNTWPAITCFDFSDPETFHVYNGIPGQRSEDNKKEISQPFRSMPQQSYFAIDGDRLYNLCTVDSNDWMIVYDITKPAEIREISRRRFPRWRQWGNYQIVPHGREATIRIDHGTLLVKSHLGVYLYEITDDFSLKKLARKTLTNPRESIHNCRYTDGRLSIFYCSFYSGITSGSMSDWFAQYAIDGDPDIQEFMHLPKKLTF